MSVRCTLVIPVVVCATQILLPSGCVVYLENQVASSESVSVAVGRVSALHSCQQPS